MLLYLHGGGVGYLIKPVVCIVPLAILFVEAIKLFRQFDKRKLVFIGLSVLLSVGIIKGGNWCTNTWANHMGLVIDSERRIGWQHFLMMGLNDDNPGAYWGEDVRYTNSFMTNETRNAANLDVAKQRILDKGIGGMFTHISKKILSSFGDGTFGHKAIHGGMVRDVPTKNHFSLILRDIFRSDGQYYNWIAITRQTLWIMVLFLDLVVMFMKPKDNVIIVAKVCVIGMFLYEMTFEANSHHAFDMISVFILIAAAGMKYISTLGTVTDKNI